MMHLFDKLHFFAVGTFFYSLSYKINLHDLSKMVEVEKNKTLISRLELKRLLTELKDLRPDICFRYRLVGEMWKPNFMRIVDVNEKGAVLIDETTDKLVFLHTLIQVVQFEIDAKFQMIQPHFHYEVERELGSFA
jgi:hypothetical protein